MRRNSQLVFSILFLISITLPVVARGSLSVRIKIYAIKGTVTTQLLNGQTNGVCLLERKLNETKARIVNEAVKIKTGNNSYAEIEYQDHSVIKLRPNTEIEIRGHNIYVKQGESWFNVEKTPGGLIIRAPSVIVGIRGTELVVTVLDNETSMTRLIRGTIDVSDINKRNTVTMGAGMAILVSSNSSSLNPEPFQLTTKDQWWTNWPTLIPLDDPTHIGNGIKRISPSADAYVYAYNYRNWNLSNRGKYDQLRAGWHPTGGESRTYIKFALPTMNPGKLTKATLKLYHFQTAGGNGVDLGIYRVTSPWREGFDTYHSGQMERPAPAGDISWMQQPSIDENPVTFFNPGNALYNWTEIDITSLVKEWLAGEPNDGLVIKAKGNLSPSTPASVYHFASRERDPNLDRPKGRSKAPVLILSTDGNSGSKTKPVTVNTGTSVKLARLPFYEDFSQGASRWSLPPDAFFKQGHVLWNSGTSNNARLNLALPMEDIVIEFDGYAKTNGINVWLQNDNKKGYTVILGGWYNTKSGSDIGSNTENRQLVDGKVWTPEKWQHYKILRSGNVLEAYCDNRLIFSRISNNHFNGYGHLRFDSWNALIGIDNIHIYQSKKSAVSQNIPDHLVSGSYQVDHRIGGTVMHSTWILNVIDGQITGTSEWTCCPGHRIDPMRGQLSGDSVLIQRDCSKQGYNGACRQTYIGELKNGHIEGSAVGTGLTSDNHWILYLAGRCEMMAPRVRRVFT